MILKYNGCGGCLKIPFMVYFRFNSAAERTVPHLWSFELKAVVMH